MKRMLGPLLLAAMASAAAGTPAPGPARAQDSQRPQRTRNVWEDEYRNRTAADMAAQFESDRRPVYRHRKDILRLLELAPGMTVAEIGAGSGFLSRMAAREVGPGGRVVATELDPKMVAYINERAAAERLLNLAAIQGRVDGAGLDTQSMDAILVVNTYSFFDRPAEMMRSIAGALKPGGLLLIVDFVRPDSPTVQDVIATGTAAGLAPIDRSDVVPSHFAVRFRQR